MLLDRILEPGSLSVCFQPVLALGDTGPEPSYFEALVRGPRGTTIESPAVLFEYVRRKGEEATVDRACVEEILGAAAGLPADAVVGLNVHASTLSMDTGFAGFLTGALEAHGLPLDRVVVEVVEHTPPWDVPALRLSLAAMRRSGVRVALDDLGVGYSNFLMILECGADYLKIDRHFVHGCHRDVRRRAIIASVAELARHFDASVVAEGIEEPADLSAVRQLGITHVQGYLFGRPAPAGEMRAAYGPLPSPISGLRCASAPLLGLS